MRKYLIYFGTEFKSLFVYWADFMLSIFVNLVYFVISFVIWKLIYNSGGNAEIATYSLSSTITYYFLVTIIYRTDLSHSMFLGQDIWEGYFTNFVVKPWNEIISYAMQTLADIAFSILTFLPFLALMILFAKSYLIMPSAPNFIFFLITLALAFIMNLIINFILHSLTFYFGDQEANTGLINWVISVFAGGMIPLAFLPSAFDWIGKLPTRFLFDFPARIFLGKVGYPELISSWAQMFIWIGILLIVFVLIYRKGLKKYSGTGR